MNPPLRTYGSADAKIERTAEIKIINVKTDMTKESQKHTKTLNECRMGSSGPGQIELSGNESDATFLLKERRGQSSTPVLQNVILMKGGTRKRRGRVWVLVN